MCDKNNLGFVNLTKLTNLLTKSIIDIDSRISLIKVGI